MSDLYLRNLAVPFLSQRKNSYTWEEKYPDNTALVDSSGNSLAGKINPDGSKYSMACRSCNITSVTMVLHYFGITDESPTDIMAWYFNGTKEKEIKEAQKNRERSFTGTPDYGVAALEDWANLYGIVKGVYGLDCEVYGKDKTNDSV
jgi:hypothetical protein